MRHTFAGLMDARTSRTWTRDAFNLWFKDSVVRAPDGTPMVYYHGTVAPTDFDTFKVDEMDLGVHFGTLDQAQDRVTEEVQPGEYVVPENARIIPVYLSIQRPLRMQDGEVWYPLNIARRLALPSSVGRYKREASMSRRPLLTGDELCSIRLAKYERQPGESEYASQRRVLLGLLKRRGYDGIVYANEHEGRRKADSYIVFDLGQAKSATGNRGTFNRNDDNMLKG